MQFKRLTDLDLRGKRVFIRADLNVPQDAAGAITDDTRIRASVPAIEHCLKAGAAVMVTSHLGRPTEGELRPEDSLAPIGRRLAELLGRPVPLVADWVDGGFTVAAGRSGAAGELPLQQGREEERRGARAQDGRAVRRLRERRVRHRSPRRGDDARHREVRAAWPARARCSRPSSTRSARRSETRAGRWSRSSRARRCRPSSRSWSRSRRRVDQLIVGGGIANTFMAAAGLPIGKSLAERDLVADAKKIIDLMAARGAQVPIPQDVVCAKTVLGRCAGDGQGRRRGRGGRPDPRHRSEDCRGARRAASPGGYHRLERTGRRVRVRRVRQGHRDDRARRSRTRKDSRSRGAATRSRRSPSSASPSSIGYISTGGGAFLEFLEGKTLPAVEALAQRAAD